MSATQVGAFAAASLLLAVTPGPGVLFVTLAATTDSA